jgi:SpoVK/Ycf46/Vps4 family AAA+-type ATPase
VLAPRRGGGATTKADASETKRDFATALLGLVEPARFPSVLVLATTNRRHAIDPALLRPPRLSEHFFFGRMSGA